MDDVELFLATHLYAGVWRTSVDSRIALITAIPLPEPKTFRLGFVCGSTPVTGKFRVFADGVPEEVTVSGGGGQALVYGKSIVIEQLSGTLNETGTWEVIGEPQLDFIESLWVIDPVATDKTLVAKLAHSVELVLTFNECTQCSPATMVVLLDKKPVLGPNGNVFQFSRRSSLIARAKEISVEVSGTCSPRYVYSGSLKIKNTKVTPVELVELRLLQ